MPDPNLKNPLSESGDAMQPIIAVTGVQIGENPGDTTTTDSIGWAIQPMPINYNGPGLAVAIDQIGVAFAPPFVGPGFLTAWGLWGAAGIDDFLTPDPVTGTWLTAAFTPGLLNETVVTIVNSGAAPPQNTVIRGRWKGTPLLIFVVPLAPPPVAPVITQEPQDGEVIVTFLVVATGTAPLTYQWYSGLSGDTSNPIIGANADTYTATIPGNYWVRVSNIAGFADSVTVQALNPPP